jgi:transcriptional regulator with XRE-family HTH domain
MTLEDYRIECGWSKSEMCRQASMDFNTLRKALNGEVVSINTAHKLVRAVSKALGRPIRIQDVEGLNFK